MSVNARGVILLGTALSVLGVTSAIVFWPSGDRPSTAPSASSSSHALGFREHRAFCEDLAKRYQSTWDTAATCTTDADCATEPRGGIYTALDGCARFYNNSLSHKAADVVAAEWLKQACSWAQLTYVDCGQARAQCRGGQCTELPPEPLPKDWQRLSLPAVMSVFAPPDFVATDARGIDSYFRSFDGRHRSIAFDVDSNGMWGERTKLVIMSERDAGTRTLLDSHFARIERDGTRAPHLRTRVVFEEPWQQPFLGASSVTVEVSCDDAIACKDVQAIISSMHFMAASFDAALPRKLPAHPDE